MMADLIALVHFAWLAWMLTGLGLTLRGMIWPGPFMDRWLFRSLHLAGMLLVALFPLLGELCPLTTWEAELRQSPAELGFVQGLLQQLLYWDFPLWAFGTAYGAAALFTLVAFFVRPPARFKR